MKKPHRKIFIGAVILAAGSTALAPLDPSISFPAAVGSIVLLIAAFTRRWDKLVLPRRRRKK